MIMPLKSGLGTNKRPVTSFPLRARGERGAAVSLVRRTPRFKVVAADIDLAIAVEDGVGLEGRGFLPIEASWFGAGGQSAFDKGQRRDGFVEIGVLGQRELSERCEDGGKEKSSLKVRNERRCAHNARTIESAGGSDQSKKLGRTSFSRRVLSYQSLMGRLDCLGFSVGFIGRTASSPFCASSNCRACSGVI